ncbi:MAG: TolC family protein [Bacteroidales bacterium]|nr:TolC family protein [Bacteroidales bacterium]
MLFVFFQIVSGQNTADVWTLQQCIDYALEHNIQIKRANFNVVSNETSLNMARSDWLPDINASLGDGFEKDISNSANAGVELNMLLFDGLRTVSNTKAKRSNVMASFEDLQKIKNDVTLNVVSLYLNVLIQKELKKTAQEQVTLSDTLEKTVEKLVGSGREPQSKLHEIRAQKANDDYNLINAENNLQLALLDLMQILEIDFDNFDIETPLFDIDSFTIPIVIFDNVLAFLPNVRSEEYRLESLQKTLGTTRASYYPNLSLSASASTTYNYYFKDKTLNTTSFFKQLSNNWRSYIGVSMSIPIFNRLETLNNLKLSKVQIQQQKIEIENAKKALFKEIQRAILKANSSRQRYNSANVSVQANNEVFRQVKERFRMGKATSFDLQQAKNNLEKSHSEYIQAKYEFIFSIKILRFYSGENL